MLSGKQFKITRPTVGIRLLDGTAKIVKVPTDGIIKVLSGPNLNGKVHETGMVYVLWEEQTIAMFAVDIEARGVEVRPEEDNGHRSKSTTSA